MKPPLLLLRFAQGRYALILLAVVLLTIWGLAELHVRHRMLTEPFVRESHREDDLKRRLAASNRRLERRAATAKALIDGCLPLAEAAAEFRALDRERDSIEKIPGIVPNRDEEAFCREVIVYIEGMLRFSPEKADVLERLELELAEHLADLCD
ncbi:MAG TPA: hypothetical protein VKE70_23735 [Candidatus Solibacter sp.]|nr:hypothetical protein [Candidatus Solibacter sp.]